MTATDLLKEVLKDPMLKDKYNLSDEDIDRIIKMHISPVNISVHTMNKELRVQMMKNRLWTAGFCSPQNL